MEYDNYGNILRKNNQWYTYGDEVWKDKLTAIGEKTITYDAQGNPTSYLGHALTWEKGRQLKSFDGNTYTYNANGIRTSKTVNGVKHSYILDGTKILRETWDDKELFPLYDNEDTVCGLLYRKLVCSEGLSFYVEESFFFLKNLQGDIIAITDQGGRVVAKYAYDAWGKCTIVEDTSNAGIAEINPYRYRSYYYDPEIGMYYLQSRYYDPIVGRFVNADDAAVLLQNTTTNVLNAWMYANNSPAVFLDSTGYSATMVIVGGVVISLETVLAYAAVALTAIFILTLLFNSSARTRLNSALTRVWDYGVDAAGYLRNAISEVVEKAKRSRQYWGTDIHHIVAHSDYRATLSRKLLYDNGLSPYEAYNLVAISRTLHKHLHTSAYHYGVYLILAALAIKAKNKQERKYYLLAGLILIGTLLSAASAAIIS